MFHSKVNKNAQTNKYSFYFTDKSSGKEYYPYLHNDYMFGNEKYDSEKYDMEVTVTEDGSYRIVRNARMLYLNVVGDKKSDYSGTNYITDFWGPNSSADNNKFKIYLFEKDVEEELYGHSLMLGGTIGANFYMQLGEEVTNDTGAYMNFTLNGEEHSRFYVKDATTKTEGETLCYIFTCGVPVKDMDAVITAQIILSNGRKGSVYTFAVRDYINVILKDTVKYEKELNLVKAMDNYGNFATAYFGNGTLEETEEMQKVTAANLAEYAAKITGEKKDIYYASSLLLKSDTILRHYFKESVEGSTQKGDVYYIDSEPIPAHKLRDTIITEVDGISITYNPLSYAYLVLGQNNIDPELKSVVRAMYLYYQEAKNYKPSEN